MDFRYKHFYKAENGENGRTKKQFGKKGQDLILRVPVGTLVKDANTKKVIVDMKEHGQKYTIVKGGKGGEGGEMLNLQRLLGKLQDLLNQVQKEKR